MKPEAKKTTTPDWKSIIMAGPEWPAHLIIPQNDPIPEGSECVQDSMHTNELWEWELWRQPDGQRYYLTVIRLDVEEFVWPRPPGLALTVLDTFQFLMTNWMPPSLVADLAAQIPAAFKGLPPVSTPASLN